MATDTPTTTLTVPAKPAAITAANLATLAGTAAAVGGPVGWAVAGAVATVPAVGYAAKKAAAKRKNGSKQPAAAHRAVGVARVPGAPRIPRQAAGGRAASTGRAGSSTPGSAARSLRGLLGKAGPSSRKTGSSSSGGGGRGGTSTGGGRSGILRRLGIGSSSATPGSRRSNTSGRTSSPNLSRIGRAAAVPLRAAGRFAGRFARGLATTPKKKATPGSAYSKNRRRGVATALGAATRVVARNGWRLLGRWFRKYVLRRKPKKKTKKKNTEQQKKVAPIVDRGTSPQQETVQPTNPKAAPGQPIQPGDPATPKENTMSTADTPSGTREMAGRMWSNVDSWNPRGMETVVQEYHDLPQALDYMRATVGTLMDKSMRHFPVDQAIAEQIGKVVECLATASQMSRRIPEAVETIHKAELDRLRNPRAGEAMWDLSANGRA
ncbi:hypothetical protein AB0L22_09145 [Micromonospora haikouensis]|uniref:hypothetical protein n=1 Tax=Micromonospora haikouensis TaxID=686309 RepID=UPI0034492128